MTYPSERRPRRERSLLDSPWLAAAIVAVAIGAGLAIVPGLLNPSGGQRPTLPPGSGIATPSPTPGTPTFVRPTPSPGPSFTTHVVGAGDTLNSIAREFDTTARSIAWWNRGTYPSLDPQSPAYRPDHLEIGWRLVLLPGEVVDDSNPPTPSPAPSATPQPSSPPAPSQSAPPAAGSAALIAHGSRTVKNLALTFDMGGRLEPAVDIVQWLIDHGVHATMFPTGASGTLTQQGLAAMQLAATRPDLFDFANHSWDHPDFRTLSRAQMADQLTRTESALAPIVGSTKPWFRPPFGGVNAEVRAGVGAAGWRYAVMWDVDMIDWRPEADGGPTAAQMVTKLRAQAQGGSIVLMHLGGWNTLEALPGLLDAAGDMGLAPVTLGEMLGA